jgi:hypothetical protein
MTVTRKECVMKDWYKSKAVWSAIAMAVIGILSALGVQVPEFVTQILMALGIYGIRDGVGKEIK